MFELRSNKGISILSFQNRSNYISIIFKIFFSIDKLIISRETLVVYSLLKVLKVFFIENLLRTYIHFQIKL